MLATLLHHLGEETFFLFQFILSFNNTFLRMFEAICDHIRYATNKGNIRSAITVFPQKTSQVTYR